MFLWIFRILLKWNSLCLMVLVTLILWYYVHQKNKLGLINFKVFVPLNTQIIKYRNLLIENDVFLFLCIKFWNQNRYSVDYKIKFCLKENHLQMNFFFIDFYNIARINSIILNENQSELKFVHGRIYLEKKHLKLGSWNTLEMSFISETNFNMLNSIHENQIVLNGNQFVLSNFIPIFDQTNLNYHISLNLKSVQHVDAFFLAPRLEKTISGKETYWNFDQKNFKINEFFLLLSSTELNLKKHVIKPFENTSIEVHISEVISESLFQARNILKLITNIVKSLKQYFKIVEYIECDLPSIEIFLLQKVNVEKDFHTANHVVVFNKLDDKKSKFSLKLAKQIGFCYSEFFLKNRKKIESDEKEEKEENFFALEFKKWQEKMTFVCDFLSFSAENSELKLLEDFYLNEILFNEMEESLKKTPKIFSNNFQIYEYFTFVQTSDFREVLKKRLLTKFDAKRFLKYTVCLGGEKAELRFLSENEKVLHSCRDCLFNSQTDEKLPEVGEFVFYLFSNSKFQSSMELICLLHFIIQFMGFHFNAIDLLSKILKNNSELIRSKKITQLVSRILRFYFHKFKYARGFIFFIQKFVETMNLKPFFISEEFKESINQLEGLPNGLAMSAHMKAFLKSNYSFQKYYFIKHSLK